MECDGRAGFSRFGFAARGRKRRVAEPKTAPERMQLAGSKDVCWAQLNKSRESKMEVPATSRPPPRNTGPRLEVRTQVAVPKNWK